MRMLNMKRFFIILVVSFTLFFTLVVSFVYFFNVNNYSEWITQQVKETTGYDLRFEHFENNWLNDSSFSLIGLSLYQQQQRILHIKRFDFQVDKLDLWQRQLAIKKISLQGVESKIDLPLVMSELASSNSTAVDEPVKTVKEMPWQRLHIGKLSISDATVSLQNEDKQLLLKEANIELNDLLIIQKNRLQLLPLTVDLSTSFKTLQISDKTQKALLNDLQLSLKANLMQRNAQFDMSTGLTAFQPEKHSPVLFDALQINILWDQEKLFLKQFVTNLFSGSLALEADALLVISLLPVPEIQVKDVTVQSLLAKNMHINIPAYLTKKTTEVPSKNNEIQAATLPIQLPIENLSINALRLQNINVSSESKSLPLQMKSADALLSDFYLIKGRKFMTPIQHTAQKGSFSLAFESLRWHETNIEQFSVAGSLSEDDQGLLLLKRLLSKE